MMNQRRETLRTDVGFVAGQTEDNDGEIRLRTATAQTDNALLLFLGHAVLLLCERCNYEN
jgi:hypothetical protein